jgi:hypothetical protein
MSLKSEDYAKLWVPVVAHVVKLLLDLIFGTKNKKADGIKKVVEIGEGELKWKF